jgi:hypothetical protein
MALPPRAGPSAATGPSPAHRLTPASSSSKPAGSGTRQVIRGDDGRMQPAIPSPRALSQFVSLVSASSLHNAFGELGLLLGQPRCATIKTEERCLFLVVSAAAFNELLKVRAPNAARPAHQSRRASP